MVANSATVIRRARTQEESREIIDFRRKVYIQERYITFSAAEKYFPDSYDCLSTSILVSARRGDKVVGSLRIDTGLTLPLEQLVNTGPFYARGKTIEISRLCVERSERSQGLARELITYGYRQAQQEQAKYIIFMAVVGTKSAVSIEYLPLLRDLSQKQAISPFFHLTNTEELLYQKLVVGSLPGWYEQMGAKPAGYMFLHPEFNTVNLPMYGEVDKDVKKIFCEAF